VKPLAAITADPANSNGQLLANIGPSAFRPLVEIVRDSRTCPQAAYYLAAVHYPPAVPVLFALLGAYHYYVTLGQPGSEDALVEVLQM